MFESESGYIQKRVHELYYGADINCARTTLTCLSELLEITLEEQTWAAAVGMHGAGGYRAQCGLVEGGLMFLGIYWCAIGKTEAEAVSACYAYAKAYEQHFGSLLCRELRPQGFSANDPPHMCEKLTCESILFTYQYVLEHSQQTDFVAVGAPSRMGAGGPDSECRRCDRNLMSDKN